MDIMKIQDKVDKLLYWDKRVKLFSCEYFADEVILIYEGSEGDISYKFSRCYIVNINHCLTYKKLSPSSQLSHGQIPYFLQDVTLAEIEQEEEKFYICKINMFPMDIEIWCKEIDINGEAKVQLDTIEKPQI